MKKFILLFVLLSLISAPAYATDADTMLSLVNDTRHSRDVKELSLDDKVSTYALRHSKKMASGDDLFHTRNLGRRLNKLGISWTSAGENVGVGYDLEGLHDAFMASRGHRRNILYKRFDYVGIGIYHIDGKYWTTLIFYDKG